MKTKNINPQTQEVKAQETLESCAIIKLLITSEKEKIFKAARE